MSDAVGAPTDSSSGSQGWIFRDAFDALLEAEGQEGLLEEEQAQVEAAALRRQAEKEAHEVKTRAMAEARQRAIAAERARERAVVEAAALKARLARPPARPPAVRFVSDLIVDFRLCVCENLMFAVHTCVFGATKQKALYDAIDEGVPLWNSGDYASCAAVYK